MGLLNDHVTPCGKPLSKSHAHALMILLACERAATRCTPTALARRLGIDKSNGTRLCRRMGLQGHTAMQRDPDDGRLLVLSLTPRGRKLATEVEAASSSLFADLLAGLPGPARRDVLTAFRRLNEALQRKHPFPEDAP